MANKDLKGKTWKIPKQYLKQLYKKLKNYNGSKKVEGYVRLKNLLTKGTISYENLKNIKHILKKMNGNEQQYDLNGGSEFERWINDTLKTARNSIENFKKAKKESGMANAYKKNHDKDSSKGFKPRTPKLHKSMSINDLNNNNVNYEQRLVSKIIITEAQLKYIKNNITHYLQ